MPAAAVIPALIAYIKVVAVKKINEASNIPDSPLFVSDYVQMMQYFMRFMEKNGKEDLEKGQWCLDNYHLMPKEYHNDDRWYD